jgi:hypothetical protein
MDINAQQEGRAGAYNTLYRQYLDLGTEVDLSGA